MANRIYISPERRPNPHGPYWGLPGVYEHDICCEIADLLCTSLIRCGFEVRIGDPAKTMEERVAEGNAWPADYYLPIHTNAAGSGKAEGAAQGPTVLACGIPLSKSWRACQKVYDRLMEIYPRKTKRGVKTKNDFYEIKNTKMVSVYPEIAFHDNGEDARWIVSHKQEIADAICRGVCDWYGVEYKADEQGDGRAPEGYITLAEHQAKVDELTTLHRQKYTDLEADVQALRARAQLCEQQMRDAWEQFDNGAHG